MGLIRDIWHYRGFVQGSIRREIVTQYEGPVLESLGYVKFDILGLKNLSVIDVAVGLVKERYGVTIDLTHAGRRTFLDACAAATRPLIASHSNPKAVADNPRNIDDDQIRAVAALGDVVCVTTWAPLIWAGTPGMPTTTH